MRMLVRGAGAVSVAVLLIAGLYAYGLRTKNRTVLTGIRRVNRSVFNPHQMKSAGTPGAYASIIQHTGRVSGSAFETPIVVRPFADGFAIVLPYSTQADWVKNVLVAGSAVIVNEGVATTVTKPRIVTLDDVASAMSDKDVRTNRMAGSIDAMHVTAVSSEQDERVDSDGAGR